MDDDGAGNGGTAAGAVSFDEFYRIRILPSDQFEAADRLKDECQTEEFNSIVQVFLGVLGEKAAQIEREKLKAIGMRNHAEREADSRAARLRELQLTIRERQAELQRLTAQHESLQSVLADQRSVIEQMSSK